MPTEDSKITVLYCQANKHVSYMLEVVTDTNIGNQIDSGQLLHHLPAHTKERAMKEPLRAILEDHLKRAL